MMLLPVIRLAVQVCLFWFAVVLVTRDMQIDWRSFILWVIAAHLAGGIVGALLGNSGPVWINSLVALLVTSAALASVLYFKFGYDGPKQIIMVIAIYFGATYLLNVILQLSACNVQSRIDEALETGTRVVLGGHLFC
ncbi:hypothetical protein KQI52_12610 [bacterium]|nr:hypothetical protein [bacterium]